MSDSKDLPRVPSGAAVMLPCTEDQFRDFISGLLGKPQTITKTIRGAFDLSLPDLDNLYHLVTQRVSQQNHGTLLSFTARIVFSDSSSVLLNSIEDLRHYSEIRPVVSEAVHLSWTFLVKFPGREIPEKQEIQVSVVTDVNELVYDEDGPGSFVRSRPSEGVFALRISHTARTWGSDIEAMLTAQIETLLKSVPPWKVWVRKHSGRIGLCIGLLFATAAIVGAFASSQRFAAEQEAILLAALTDSGAAPAQLLERVNKVLETVIAGAWPRHLFYSGVFLAGSIILAIVFGVWAGSAADNREPSFLLLTPKSEKARTAALLKVQRAWLRFGASVAVSIVASVVGNILFLWLQN